jgi:hypothetical protein
VEIVRGSSLTSLVVGAATAALSSGRVRRGRPALWAGGALGAAIPNLPGKFKCLVKGCHKRHRDIYSLIKHIQTKHQQEVVVKVGEGEE